MQSQSMFKDNALRQGSFGDGTRSNMSHFDTTSKLYRDMPVEDQLRHFEYNWKRSKDKQHMILHRKSEIASQEASKGNIALTKANEITEKKEYDVLKDFVTG